MNELNHKIDSRIFTIFRVVNMEISDKVSSKIVKKLDNKIHAELFTKLDSNLYHTLQGAKIRVSNKLMI